jgi:hypothetical protein
MESIDSLLDNASAPHVVEILIAVDPDEQRYWRACAFSGGSVWAAPERFGYARLHEYYNFLASKARGEWLMLWNDDARMRTAGWDDIIHGSAGLQYSPMSVLWPQVNHAEGGNLFPVWPRWWADTMGYVSLASNIDVWVSEIARRLGVEQRIPVEIFHDRADVTGGHDDQTFAEGRALMGQGNESGYDSQRNRVERSRAVRVLREAYRDASA